MNNDWKHIDNLMSDIPIFWINLDRAERRRKILEDKLNKLTNKNFRVKAIDGKELKIEDINKKHRVHEKLSIYEVACALSHIHAIKEAYNSNFEHVLILEDDANFDYFKYHNQDLVSLFNEAKKRGCECLQLGYTCCKRMFASMSNSHHKFQNTNTAGAVAYVINRAGMKRIIDLFNKNNTILLSEYMVFKSANTFITRPYFSYPFLKDENGYKVNVSFIRAPTNGAHATQTLSKMRWDDYYLS